MFPPVAEFGKNELTIRHSADGFSYAVYNIERQQFTEIKNHFKSGISLKETIAGIEAENSCEIRHFNKISVIFDNCRNTFVPASVFQNQIKSKYLDILGLTNENSVVCDDFIKSTEAHNVYAVSAEDFDTLQKNAEKTVFHHASSVLVASLVNDNMERTDDIRIYLNIKNQSFEMTVLKGANLLFDNNFRFKTKEDFLYFLLFSTEQLHIDTSSVPVYFLGMIEEKSKLVELTARYVRDIRFMRRDNEIGLAQELEETPFYFHYILYKSIKCAL